MPTVIPRLRVEEGELRRRRGGADDFTGCASVLACDMSTRDRDSNTTPTLN